MADNYPPLARLSSDIEDRRGENPIGMLLSYARGQLTPEKLRMVMAHPMMSAVDRANLINAQINPGVSSLLGDALGFNDMRLR
jgi:hypothetical protein